MGTQQSIWEGQCWNCGEFLRAEDGKYLCRRCYYRFAFQEGHEQCSVCEHWHRKWGEVGLCTLMNPGSHPYPLTHSRHACQCFHPNSIIFGEK